MKQRTTSFARIPQLDWDTQVFRDSRSQAPDENENERERCELVNKSEEGFAMLLFRPVGLRELELIAASGWREYPPRFAWQPIFYPVVTREYARAIVTQWNSKETDAGHCGFVTEFHIDDEFVSRYPV